jgi:nicotinamidase-related amidase
MAQWDKFLTDRDKQVFAGAGYGARAGFGKRPVLLVIDVNVAFCGDEPAPILESIKKWRNSCGEEAWQAVGHIERLLAAAREKRLPIIYSTGERPTANPFARGRWTDKNPRGADDHQLPNGDDIVAPIAPRPQDIVIEKAKPSVFFGTMLAGYLADLGADSIIACGTTTSGCVRATVVDGFSYNYRMSVVEECTFDRGQASHAINLFDLNAKYADVVGIDETVDFIRTLPDDLFIEDMPVLAEPDRDVPEAKASAAAVAVL